MTKKQWRLLEILRHWGGSGTIEVETQWGDYEMEDDEEGLKGWRITRIVVAGLMRTLVAKGLATNDDSGYGITDRGIALLDRRKARSHA